MLEAVEKTTTHVLAGFGTTRTGMVAGHSVGAVRRHHHLRLRRRQGEAGRNGDQRHRHGQEAKGDTAAMKRISHGPRVPQPEGGDKNATASCLSASYPGAFLSNSPALRRIGEKDRRYPQASPADVAAADSATFRAILFKHLIDIFRAVAEAFCEIR